MSPEYRSSGASVPVSPDAVLASDSSSAPSGPSPSAIEHPGSLIKMLNALLEKSANNALRADGLTVSQITVLMAMEEAGGTMPMKHLEGVLLLSQPTVTGIVQRLEAKHLVSSRADPHDARVKLLSLTDKGRKCCANAKLHMTETDEVITRGFSKEEMDTFIGFLWRVIQNVKQE
jgi:MarR family transcriptional repressor of mepA